MLEKINKGDNMERLQKVIAKAGIASRRKAEKLIVEGKVKVNGKIVRELGVKVTTNDKVDVDGMKIENEEKVYFIINKPRGCISAASDDKGRDVVVDFLKHKGVKERVFPVGRLDYDTSGALIITNDGELANILMHPKNLVDKIYLVRCKGLIKSAEIMKLKRGVEIDGYKTAPAIVKLLSVDKKNDSSQLRIIIHEGKYHQVKKMFEAVGHEVKKLRRECYAFLDVQGLKPGDFRPLKIHEVKQLYTLAKYKQDNYYQLRRR